MPNKKSHDQYEAKKLHHIIDQQKSEIHRLENIIDDLPGDIYWKSKEGTYQGMNAQGRKHLRSMGFPWRKEDIIGKTDHDLFDKKTAKQFKENDLKVMQQKVKLVEEESATLPSGGTVVQLSSKRPLFDAKGNVTGIVGNTVDITEIKQTQKALKLASAVKSEFIANLSHDLHRLMTGISGMLDSMTFAAGNAQAAVTTDEPDVYKPALTELIARTQEYSTIAKESTNELINLFNEILETIQLESGKTAPEPESSNV